jgi:hypothetical protein
MSAVGCPGAARWALPLPSDRAQEWRHVFVVNLHALASQEGCKPPRAIGRPCPDEALDGGLQGRRIPGARRIVIVAASGSQHTADLAPGMVGAEHGPYLALDLDRWGKMLGAFLRISFFRGKRPTGALLPLRM